MRSFIHAVSIATVVLAACSSDDDTTGGTSSSGSSGTTSGNTSTSGGGSTTSSGGGGTGQPCGMQNCRTGQYCKDAVLSQCENGCLNNQNCASDQTCNIPDGASVGTCANSADKAELGQPCAADAGCKSGTCLIAAGDTSGICSQTCTAVTDCPGGFTAWNDCGSFPGRGGLFCLPK